MRGKTSFTEKCHRILEEKGGKIADRAKAILLDEVSVKALEQPLRYVSKIWRDPLVPSLVVLSCEAVGAKPDEATHQASIAISLLNLSCKLWDDIIDRTEYIGFVPTLPGKFGDDVSLIVGGLISAKAFSILAGMKVSEPKRQITTTLVWDYCRTIGKEEAANLELRNRNDVRPEEKFRLFEMGGANLGTSMKIGGMLGDGSENEIRCLGNYGRCLGTILALEKDLKVSVNMTLDLSHKVTMNALPYALLWAKARSEKTERSIQRLAKKSKPSSVKRLVEAVLETGAIENTLSIIDDLTAEANREVSTLRKSDSHRLLKFFVEAQHRILTDSLYSVLP